LDVSEIMEDASADLSLTIESYKEKCLRNIDQAMTDKEIYDLLIKNALENIDEASPNWTYFAGRLYTDQLYREAAKNRDYDASETYHHFYALIEKLTDKGIYHESLLEKYSQEEISFFGSQLQKENDQLFTYLALYTLATRYLATDHEKNVYELPQERWMVIAMYLMQDEKAEKRRELVLESYWALSNLYMTVATPTLNNAGKTHGQLSSCFIDTVDDSLQSIYDVNSDVAQLSKNGGGIGVYM